MAEPGNTAMMRDALRQISFALWNMIDPGCNDDCCAPKRELARLADAALAAPARNCDIGTAEEQAERFEQFCLDNHSAEHLCSRCTLGKQLGNDVDMCQLHWAQMPFAPTKGGAK